MQAVTSLNSQSRDARSICIWLRTASDNDNGPGVSKERCLVKLFLLKLYSSMDLEYAHPTREPLWRASISSVQQLRVKRHKPRARFGSLSENPVG